MATEAYIPSSMCTALQCNQLQALHPRGESLSLKMNGIRRKLSMSIESTTAATQVLSVYDADNGTRIGGPLDLPTFYGVTGPPENGMSDPYCTLPPPHMELQSSMWH